MLRAVFGRVEGEWELQRVTAVPTSAVPEEDRDFAFEAARAFFARRLRPAGRQAVALRPRDPVRPDRPDRAVGPTAIEKFVDAAEGSTSKPRSWPRGRGEPAAGVRRAVHPHHHRGRPLDLPVRAPRAAEGLVVIDDPVSILRCTNKVYLAELLARHGVPTPRTLIVARTARDRRGTGLGLPCIVKQPDSSSSLGVFKADDPGELDARSTACSRPRTC